MGFCLSFTVLIVKVKILSGISDNENGAEEGFLNLTEANDMKGGSMPISTAAIMPSPALLWRFKVSLFIKLCISNIHFSSYFLLFAR